MCMFIVWYSFTLASLSPIEDKLVTKERKSKKERVDKSPKGRNRNQPTTIQSQSIFEQGPTNRVIKRGTGS